MNFVFLMDPLESVKFEKDTTFILMLGASRRGHIIHFVGHGGITLHDGKVFFDVTTVVPQSQPDAPFVRVKPQRLAQESVDALLIRTDPPFNEKYLLDTWLLNRLSETTAIINHPAGIRTVNEKLWATQFTAFVPPTLVTHNKQDLLDFLNREVEIILKPTDGFGGSQVFYLKQGDINTHVILETLSDRYTRYVIAQKYIAASRDGDKRILLLDGEPLGAVLRVHARDDHRNNFYAGGKPYPAEITDHDRKIIAALKPHLQSMGLYFVGIDLIGGYLIEVNVTSPTCLQEMNRLYGKALEDPVIDFIEKLAVKFKSGSSPRTAMPQ